MLYDCAELPKEGLDRLEEGSRMIAWGGLGYSWVLVYGPIPGN